MKKKLLFTVLFISLIIPALPQVKTIKPTVLTLAKPKIKVTGFAAYYGNAKYVSASISLELNGKPLTNVKVRINNSVLNNHGNGTYNGAIHSPYRIKLGNELVYTAEFPKTLYRTIAPPPFIGKIELGSYKISNIINWVWPKPGQTIPTGRFLAYLFKWNFTGTPAPTEFFIKDKKTHKKIYSKTTSAEQQSVGATLFNSGRKYVMGMWAVDPIDKFKLSKHCARGSKIDWYFSSTMVFNTENGLTPLIRKK